MRFAWGHIGGLLIAIGAIGNDARPVAGLEVLGVYVPGTAEPVEGLPYELSFQVTGAAEGVAQNLEEASLLAGQKNNGVVDSAALAALARADVKQLTAALYADGYYAGEIEIKFNGQPLADFRAGDDIGPAVEMTKAPDAEVPSQPPVAVSVTIMANTRLSFGVVTLAYQNPIDDDLPELDTKTYGLVPGDVARSSLIVEATERILSDLRAQGFALAKVVDKKVVADHASHRVDVRILIDAGRRANIGMVTVVGATHLNAARINDQTALEPGRRYNPKDLQVARDRLRKFESIESVRVHEGKELDEIGAIPIVVEVREREQRYIGAAASVSSIDGAEVQAYWGHRNLFGEGERLRLEGVLSNIGTEPLEDLQYRFAVNLVKPGIFDIDTDLVTEFSVERERPETFDSKTAKLNVGLTHRFMPQLKGNVSVEGLVSNVEDETGTNDFALIGLPAELVYDGRDSVLEPSTGWRGLVAAAPYFDVRNDTFFLHTRAQASHYVALDPEGKLVLAGRVGIGTVVGADLEDIPATHRFFAGGSGSVRGFGFQSLGTEIDDRIVGGRSSVDGALEFRYRVTPTIGIVPFVDAALVSNGSLPDGDEEVRVGAGLGLRYYTALGPLRFDGAVPLNPESGDDEFAFYLGLGQAF